MKELELKKAIIKELKEKPLVLGQLERRLRTSNNSILRQIKELEILEIVKTTKHKKHPNTGRPCTTAELTAHGKKLKLLGYC